jgi:uncharacterized protein
MKIKTVTAALGISFGLCSTVMADNYQNAVRVLDAGDSVGAVEYLKACATQGDTRCEVALASFYQRGEGIEIDYSKAFSLYDRAARKGDAIAQLNLAELYETGLFVAKNKTEAYFWYALAADQGKEWAAVKADKMATQISSENFLDAQKRMKLFQDSL